MKGGCAVARSVNPTYDTSCTCKLLPTGVCMRFAEIAKVMVTSFVPIVGRGLQFKTLEELGRRTLAIVSSIPGAAEPQMEVTSGVAELQENSHSAEVMPGSFATTLFPRGSLRSVRGTASILLSSTTKHFAITRAESAVSHFTESLCTRSTNRPERYPGHQAAP